MNSSPPQVSYVLYFYLFTTTERGYGKKVWRLCSAHRRFLITELPRITPKGEVLQIDWYEFVAIDTLDSIGHMSWSASKSGISTRVQFHLRPPKDELVQEIRGIPCLEPHSGSEEILRSLRDCGFSVMIGKPSSQQEPTITPHPCQQS
jgi:hypothetical protein